mgnify:CR=1 FL=1|jgi:uncharacterized membrane protein|tara:strand:- start:392 stop:577 length:186 start_codon:yes stop_codon:yes gene_type:complete
MKLRLLFKTATYGIMHLFVATGVSYAITRDIAMSLSIGIIEPIIQTFMFAIHDYLWEPKIK